MLSVADPTDLDDGPRAKPGTGRMCVVSRQVKSVDELIRYVMSPSGDVVADLKRKLPGRGLWVSASQDAVDQAVRRGLFAKGFKRDVKAPADLSRQTGDLIARSALEALGIVAKAGNLVTGFTKVEQAIANGSAVALINASDGAADGIRKLTGKWAQRTAPDPEKISDFPHIHEFTTDELDLALGRSNVVHAALLAGPATKTFLARWSVLHRFRPGAGGTGKSGEQQRA